MAASPAKRIRTPAFTPFSPVANDARIDNTLERMRDERESDGTLGVWGKAWRSCAGRVRWGVGGSVARGRGMGGAHWPFVAPCCTLTGSSCAAGI